MNRFCAFLVAAVIGPHALVAGAQEYRWEGVERVVAFGDVHGAYDALTRLLRATGVVDQALNWTGGRTHLVSLGDLLDRGADSRKALDLLRALERQADAAGGRVHVVLGNHEMMNLTGDLRYVAPGEFAAFAADEHGAMREQAWTRFKDGFPSEAEAQAAFDQAFPPGYFAHRAAFSVDGVYGAWLLQRPLTIVINDSVFTHGGLPPLAAQLGLGELNGRLRGQLHEFLLDWQALVQAQVVSGELAAPDAAIELEKLLEADPPPVWDSAVMERVQRFVGTSQSDIFDADGPLWYRGSALCPQVLEEDTIAAALEELGAKRLVVGHSPTSTRRVMARLDGRVIVADTGMLAQYYNGTPAALEIIDGQLRVIYPDLAQQGEPLHTGPGNSDGWPGDAAMLEAFLANAEVVASQSDGQPGQTLLTLRDGEREATAVSFGRRAGRNELAAYRLDRMLGLGLVPVTVERTSGERGVVVQWRGDGWYDERQRVLQSRPVMSWCAQGNAYDLQYAIDALTHNSGRQPDNMFYSDGGSKLWLTGFADAFGTRKGVPAYLASHRDRLALPPALARRLAAITAAQLEAETGDLLSERARRALLQRRDELLEDWQRLPSPRELR